MFWSAEADVTVTAAAITAPVTTAWIRIIDLLGCMVFRTGEAHFVPGVARVDQGHC